MKRFSDSLVRFLILAIIVLVADLLINIMNNYIFTLDLKLNSFYITIFRMLFIIVSYFLAINRIEALSHWFLSVMNHTSQRILGPFWGLLFLFLISFTALFAVYHRLWFGSFFPVKTIEGMIRPVYGDLEKEIKKKLR